MSTNPELVTTLPADSKRDEEHLRLLGIFHYIAGAIMLLGSCIFLIHIFIGVMALVAPDQMAEMDGNVPPAWFGWLFIGIGGFFLLSGWALGVCTLLAGRFMRKRTHYTFCVAIGALECLFMPIGTVLGVFSLIVLLRPSVKAVFEERKRQRPGGLRPR